MIPPTTPPGTPILVQLQTQSQPARVVTRERPRRVAGRWIVVIEDGRGFSLERCELCGGSSAGPA